jgi:hypothetical protein
MTQPYQDFPPSLLTLSPRLTRVGDPGAIVQGINTTPPLPVPSPPASGWVPSEYELQLVPLAGPINSRRVVFKVSSEGETQTLRGARAGAPATVPTNLTTGALWSSGIGDPNGAVTGNKGDLWSRQDGGAATCFYVKETNGGNLGWVAK